MAYLGVRALVPFLSVLALGLWPTPAVATSGGSEAIVVNEVAAGKYVELRNVSRSTVDISAYNLWLCDNNAVVSHQRLAVGRELDPGAFYVLAASSFTGGPVDQTYRGALPRGGAMLLDPGYGWVDGVAVVANSPCGLGNPAPACPGEATARDADSTNTGDNARDFTCRTMSPGEPNE
jgi:hypothetical protein